MASTKVLIFGGTGATGLVTVEKALEAGFDVTVYARTPSKLPASIASRPKVKTVQGDLTDVDSLSKALDGQDVVLSLLGPSTVTGPGDTFPTFYRLLFKLMREHHVRRIYALGTFSIDDANDKYSILRVLLVWFIWTIANHAWREFVGIGKVFAAEANDLDWTVFRVGFLLNGEGRETAAGYIGDGKIMLHIRRNEIARWLVDEAKKEDSEWVRKFPGLASGPKVKTG